MFKQNTPCAQAAKSYKGMFSCFPRVYEGDKSFTCLDINKEGLRTHKLSVFISLKGACLVRDGLRTLTGVTSGQAILLKMKEHLYLLCMMGPMVGPDIRSTWR